MRTSFLGIAFLLVWGFIAAFLYRNYEEKRSQHLTKDTAVLETTYRAGVEVYRMATELLFREVVEQSEILNTFARGVKNYGEVQELERAKLFRLLSSTYDHLKEKGMLLFHFHTADGRSFLRFHLPEKYGDPLFEARPCLKVVNSKKQPVHEFELGKVKSGFRNVFPLSLNGEHLGSVEISIAFDQVRESVSRIDETREYDLILNRQAVFRVLKKEWQWAYPQSDIHPDFVEDHVFSENMPPPQLPEAVRDVNGVLRKDLQVQRYIAEGKSFTWPVSLESGDWAVSFVVLRDVLGQQVGYFISYSRDDFLANLRHSFYIALTVATLVLAGLFYFTWYLLSSRERVRKEKQYLATITDTIGDGLYVVDPKGIVVQINTAFTEMLGYEVKDVVGKVGHDIFHAHGGRAGNLPLSECSIHRETTAGNDYYGEEIFQHKDGHTIVVEVAARGFSDGLALQGVVSAFRDVTEKKHLANELENHRNHLQELVEERTAQLEESRQEAEKAVRVKTEFLANMSHEIRTPMNGIIGMTYLALQTDLNDRQKNYIAKAHGSAESLLGILDDILDYSKMEAGKLQFEAVDFQLKDVIANMISLIKVKADEKKIEIAVRIGRDVPKLLNSDPLRLSQVLTNLGSNAVKFSEVGGEIALSVSVEHEYESGVLLHFAVQDSGIGISPEQQERLFKPFSQADSSTTRMYGGTGLGLIISQKVVRMMGGEIWVESEQERGSTFHFTGRFKKVKEDFFTRSGKFGRDEKTSASAHALARLQGAKILLVEDNEVNQELVRDLLHMNGLVAKTACNGKEALEMLAKEAFDGVLMDCQMPVMDGYDATCAIRSQERYQSLPVIAMTANAMKGDRDKVLAVGMNDHIPKPINPDQMFSTMAKWINTKGHGQL